MRDASNAPGLLDGRVAIVTGAGKGLGRAYAIELARQGARVLVNNRVREGQPNSADAVVEEIRAFGGSAEADYTSVESDDSGTELVSHALDAFGALDTVVANAGMDHPRSFHKQQWSDFEAIFRVNFYGAARLLHAAWPGLRDSGRGRALVSISSAGLYGNHGQAAYASSKSALVGLVKSLAIECGNSELRINALAPYAVTPLTLPWFPREDADRFSPGAVAPLVAWLVSGSCVLNGRVLVSGGGGVRLADALETETVALGEGVEQALARVVEMPRDQAPGSASGEFEEFSESLRGVDQ
jgi:NAD(P)-dependent dehydrogenase (short-subunit alcohol dehydrogenase family)